MALIDKLVDWWKLGEASGNRVGSHAATVLSDNNSVTQETGKNGKAAGFASASTQFLSASSATWNQFNGTALCITFWVNVQTGSQTSVLVGKDVDSPANSRDYTIDLSSGVLRAYWNGGGGSKLVGGGTPSGWTFVAAKLVDAGGGNYTIAISTNGGAWTTATDSGTPDVSSAQLRIGARAYASFEGYCDAFIDELAFWDQELTLTEVKFLAQGVTYEDVVGVTKSDWDPDAFPVPYASNPIITAGSVTWYERQIYDCNVIPDPNNSANLLMYASGMTTGGTQSIGLFLGTVAAPFTWSENGGSGSGQVLTPTGVGSDWDENQTRLSCAIYNEDTDEIWLYYSGAITNGSDNAIGLAIADAATPDSFTRSASNPILTIDGNGNDDGTGFVQQCSVMPPWESGLSYWVMVYQYVVSGANQYRVATSADGISWTKTGTGDVLIARPDGGAYAGPEFLQLKMRNGFCHLIFESGSGSVPYSLYVATALTPEGPFSTVHYEGIPLLPASGAADFEDKHTATPYLVEIAGKNYLFYCGTDNSAPFTGIWSAAVAVYEPGSFQDAFTDDFTDTNGTSLPSHNASWSADVGTFQIQSNKATTNSDSNDDQATVDAGASDVIVTCTVTPRATNSSNVSDPGIIIRGSDSTHFWLVSVSAGTQNLILYENDGGYSLIQGVAYSFVDNVSYEIKVRCHRAGITVYVDGVEQIIELAAYSNLTATSFGIRLGKAGTPPGSATWDNFSVQEFVEGGGSTIPALDQGMLIGGLSTLCGGLI